MGKLLSICSTTKATFFKAKIEIAPIRSFEAIVEIMELLFGAEFSKSIRFDEFPANVATVDNHEIILFGAPEMEFEDDEGISYFRLSIFPRNPPLEARIKDVSELLVVELEKFGIQGVAQ
jgi:hypothetical protein